MSVHGLSSLVVFVLLVIQSGASSSCISWCCESDNSGPMVLLVCCAIWFSKHSGCIGLFGDSDNSNRGNGFLLTLVVLLVVSFCCIKCGTCWFCSLVSKRSAFVGLIAVYGGLLAHVAIVCFSKMFPYLAFGAFTCFAWFTCFYVLVRAGLTCPCDISLVLLVVSSVL